MLTLVLGPVRSGKSARAAALAKASGRPVLLAATAAIDPDDREMRARVERHRRDRCADWTVVETATETSLPALLRDAPPSACVVVDALGTWIAALLWERGDDCAADVGATADYLDERGRELVAALRASAADVIVVAEETGWGVVPAHASGRTFRDALGRLTQEIGKSADRVELVVAGYAVDLRAIGTPIAEVGPLKSN